MRRLTLKDLVDRVEKDPETQCWNYTGYVDVTGYGIFSTVRGSNDQLMPARAHWFSYESFIGQRQPGMHIHHLCHNKRCVNPDHLVQLDPADHAREHYGDTCPRGHGEEHWRITQKGSRYCRACDLERNAANRARRSVPCTACGKPRLADVDAGQKRNFTGLCRPCWLESRRKTAAA